MAMTKINIPNESLPSLEQLPILISVSHLSGEKGTNRETEKHCQIHAKNDYEAIQCWLNEYRQKVTTYRVYQKESERLLLWAIFQCEKPLSSLDRDDFEIYFKFLDDPQPSHIWCAKDQGRGRKRGALAWRPFVSGLSVSAKQTAISSIDSLFNYLVDARYLSFNPLSLIRKRRIRKPMQSSCISLQDRMLDIEEWYAMLDTLDNFPENSDIQKHEKERLRFLVHILYFLGLRIHELATHTWSSFCKIENEWWFYVIGKGDKEGMIPVCDEFLRSIISYRAFLKKSPYPNIEEHTPIICSLTSGEAITPRQMNKLLKRLAIETTNKFQNNSEKVRKLKKFSAHWLRHLSASMQDRAGIKFKHIKENHRHENDDTTRKYVHSINKERHHDMQKMKLR